MQASATLASTVGSVAKPPAEVRAASGLGWVSWAVRFASVTSGEYEHTYESTLTVTAF